MCAGAQRRDAADKRENLEERVKPWIPGLRARRLRSHKKRGDSLRLTALVHYFLNRHVFEFPLSYFDRLLIFPRGAGIAVLRLQSPAMPRGRETERCSRLSNSCPAKETGEAGRTGQLV